MNVRQLVEALASYPPDAPVAVHVMTGDGAATVLDVEVVVDASQRNGATGRIAEHRAAIRTRQITRTIHPVRTTAPLWTTDWQSK